MSPVIYNSYQLSLTVHKALDQDSPSKSLILIEPFWHIRLLKLVTSPRIKIAVARLNKPGRLLFEPWKNGLIRYLPCLNLAIQPAFKGSNIRIVDTASNWLIENLGMVQQ